MLTPLVPWRPPGGRPVSPGEMAICLPFLHRLIGLLQPRRLVIFGGTAARAAAAAERRAPPPGAWLDRGSHPGDAADAARAGLAGHWRRC